MKSILIHITIISMFSFNAFAQKAKESRTETETATQKVPDSIIASKSTNTKTITSYHVKEDVNQRFGGYTLTYEVLDEKFINTYDLGPNNTRVITPSYKEVKQNNNFHAEPLKPVGISATKSELQPINTNIITPAPKVEEIKEAPKTEEPKIVEIKKNDTYVYIHLIKVYERIAEKGYKSIEIFQKLGDSFFFEGDYTKAAKWYTELFKMTTELSSPYYDRYAHSLNMTGQKNKAEDIKKKRKELFGNN